MSSIGEILDDESSFKISILTVVKLILQLILTHALLLKTIDAIVFRYLLNHNKPSTDYSCIFSGFICYYSNHTEFILARKHNSLYALIFGCVLPICKN